MIIISVTDPGTILFQTFKADCRMIIITKYNVPDDEQIRFDVK